MTKDENIAKPKFWICRPHEGPEEFEFDLVSIIFSDNIERFICKSDIVPPDYTPKVVYMMNKINGLYYDKVGNYKKENGVYILVP
jgi:hypothetical protein